MKLTINDKKNIDLDINNGKSVNIGGLEDSIFTYQAPVYEGEYNVIPKAYEEQVLQTKEKTLLENVTVQKVPFYEISNAGGGTTVYIAEETKGGKF